MNKELINYRLRLIVEQLSTEQILYARRNRNWKKFDKLNEFEKLIHILEELEIYSDIIDPNYDSDGFNQIDYD